MREPPLSDSIHTRFLAAAAPSSRPTLVALLRCGWTSTRFVGGRAGRRVGVWVMSFNASSFRFIISFKCLRRELSTLASEWQRRQRSAAAKRRPRSLQHQRAPRNTRAPQLSSIFLVLERGVSRVKVGARRFAAKSSLSRRFFRVPAEIKRLSLEQNGSCIDSWHRIRTSEAPTLATCHYLGGNQEWIYRVGEQSAAARLS